jgi:hypothetical protein
MKRAGTWGAIVVMLALVLTAWMGWIGGARAQPTTGPQIDPLPSWNDGPTKTSILAFVRKATTPSDPGFVAPEDRIATFDQDGTLWAEHPLYTEAMFALDRLKQIAPEHPEWKQEDPFQAVLGGDKDAIAKMTQQDWARIVGVTHSGMRPDQFQRIVEDWLGRAKDPRFKQPYTSLVYTPMLELMSFLRANGFQTFIVTGGGQDFVRAYSQKVYGIPSQQVIGSNMRTRFEHQQGVPVVMTEPGINFVDDNAGKPLGIQLFIGKRPTAAFGNSDGDREMLEWTSAGDGSRFGMVVLHDDKAREYAYGPASGLPDTKVGTLSQSLLDEAHAHGWVIISMKNDWKRIFPFGQ